MMSDLTPLEIELLEKLKTLVDATSGHVFNEALEKIKEHKVKAAWAEKAKEALEKIKEVSKPCYDNDPLGMGAINPEYRYAQDCLDEYPKENK